MNLHNTSIPDLQNGITQIATIQGEKLSSNYKALTVNEKSYNLIILKINQDLCDVYLKI